MISVHEDPKTSVNIHYFANGGYPFLPYQINPLLPDGNKKLKGTGLFKYVWPFCYHQALKG